MTGRPVRCALTRREENPATGNRHATIQRLVAGARSDGTLTALGGDYVMAVGWEGWKSSTAGPMQMLYACPNVRTDEARREGQHGPERRLPRPRLRRGHLRPRVPPRRAGGEARPRPARAPAAEPCRLGPGRRPPVLLQEPARVLPARRCRTGRGATRSGRARTGPGSTASASPARSGTAAAAHPPTRGCGWAPTAART